MKTTYIYVILVVVLVGGLLLARNYSEPEEVASTKYDAFGQCLADAGAIFYGAFWCPHCNEQKALFENSSTIPYTECSLPNRQQNQLCTDEGVASYPTWKFSDRSVETGVVQLEALAEKTGCELPA